MCHGTTQVSVYRLIEAGRLQVGGRLLMMIWLPASNRVQSMFPGYIQLADAAVKVRWRRVPTTLHANEVVFNHYMLAGHVFVEQSDTAVVELCCSAAFAENRDRCCFEHALPNLLHEVYYLQDLSSPDVMEVRPHHTVQVQQLLQA